MFKGKYILGGGRDENFLCFWYIYAFRKHVTESQNVRVWKGPL